MYNIIKGINYYGRKDLPVFVTVFFMFTLPLISAFELSGSGTEFEYISTSVYFTESFGDLSFLVILLTIIITARIVGSDLGDKTLNYEIMGGHKRFQVYFGRTAAGILWGAVLPWLVMALPFIYFTVLNGWNKHMVYTDPEEIIFRFLLLLFPLFRLTVIYIVTTFITKSAGKAMIFIYLVVDVLIMIAEIMDSFFDIKLHYWTAVTSFQDLSVVSNSRSMVIEGKEYMFFDGSLSTGYIAGTVAVNLILGIIYMTIGYVIFKRKDRA